MAKEKIDLNILGMSCVNCSKNIEEFISKQDGVYSAKVSFASSDATFEIDGDIYPKKRLIQDITSLGYSATETMESLQKEQLKIFEKLKFLTFFSLSITAIMFLLMFTSFVDEHIKKYVMFLLASIVQFYGGALFYKHGFIAIKNRNYDMNVLVALGTSAAYFYSTFVVFIPDIFPETLRFIYFDGAAVIISFVLLGKYLEENSKQKAGSYLKKLMDLAPMHANLITADSNIKTVLAANLQIGDKVLVKSGEQIPTDGFIIEGEADINTAMVTGESLPQYKTKGDEVLSGTLNTNGILKIEVLKASKDTTLAKIIDLLKSAQSKQIPISRFADKIANIFVPSVIFISFVTFIIWSVIGNYQNAILASISVVIISCPCALGLATPIAIVSAVSRGAKEGILIKNPEILEQIKEIRYAVFDKTGTLTKGEISVSNTNIEKKYFQTIGSLEKYSEHPISKAIVEFLKAEDIVLNKGVKDIQIIAGQGIKGIVDNEKVLIGNKSFLEQNNTLILQEHLEFYNKELDELKGVVLVSIDGESVGSFSLMDELRDDAFDMIERLKKIDIEPILLTGDNKTVALKIGDRLGIDKIYSEVLPNGKYEIIKKLQEDAKVMFIGDGINDAPSIKQANIGITLNSGSDIAKDAGDIILINNRLELVVKSINLSNETMKIVKQNLFWAFFYNALGIPLAAGILYPISGVMLTPMYAGIAMSFSSVTVVLNSLRLKFIGL